MHESQTTDTEFDVVVIGGGPSGCALATILGRQGHCCLVLESSTFPRYHVGESLIPHTYETLDRLGLLAKLRASHFPVKRSVRFVSASGRESDAFYFSETIEGDRARTWQVDRSEFDQMCLENAIDSGVEVRTAARVANVLFEGERATGVVIRSADSVSYEVRARAVVDASGRTTVIGTQLGLKSPVPGLDKSSLWSYYRGGELADGVDAGETTIFATHDGGWFWHIPLPDDVVSVGIVGNPEHMVSETADSALVFERHVESCASLHEKLAAAERLGPVRSMRRLAYVNRPTCGDGWVMIGDARAFLDPIYSSGLFLALASAELAADCLHEALESNDLSAANIGRFEAGLVSGVDVIHRLIYAFYDPVFSFGRFVKRFPEHRGALIDCLVGDVIKDMGSFTEALAEMTPPPPPLVS